MSDFTTIRTVGGLLPPDLLARVVAGDRDLAGLTSSDYHLASGETPREAATRAWSYLTGVWAGFTAARDRLPDGDPAVGPTREKWLLVLLRELGYGRIPVASGGIPVASGGIPVGDRTFPVSHLWERTPMHLLGWGVDLDRRTKGVAGAADRAPHAMLQELLNRSDSLLWGLLSNGRVLRVLRDSTSLSGQSYLEFDLEAMFDGEVFSDFVVLFLTVHQSRVGLGTPDAPATDCWLERWRTASIASGTRALGLLRDGVKASIEALGTGFLQHPANAGTNRRLADGELRLDDYRHALLRLVYRLLFLFVAEDRQALHSPDADAQARARYATYFSAARLRRLALKRRGTKHTDLWQAFTLVVDALGNPGDAGLDLPDGIPELGLPGLGGIFEIGEVDVVHSLPLSNDVFLAAVRHLAVVQPKGQPKRTVDYRDLGAEELGSIYESLLELVPRHDAVERTFTLVTLAGNDRKTSGSYYTPTALIDFVLDEALDPVLDDAETSAATAEEAAKALLAVTVCDPACGSGHFLVAAARRIAHRLAVVRTGDVDPTPADLQGALHDVVARCVYGIDLNPLAAELAKISLWLEALQPGKPLTFLDAHVKIGNALLGATPALLAAGIPDQAFKPVEGDDKKWVAALRRHNQVEREKSFVSHHQQDLFAGCGIPTSNATVRAGLREVARLPVAALADVRLAAKRFRAVQSESAVRRAFDTADTWCAAFVVPKSPDHPAITQQVLVDTSTGNADAAVRCAVQELVRRYRFFHWHLEFPGVFDVPEGDFVGVNGWAGGFSCVVGNPPWEQVKLKEVEFFASRDSAIARVPRAADRKRLIARLEETGQPLWSQWQEARRRAESESHFLRNSGRFPLTGRGDVNTYGVFAETVRDVLARGGRAGILTPTGLATDVTMSEFFADTLFGGRLGGFYDFQNSGLLFKDVSPGVRFALTVFLGHRGDVGSIPLAFVLKNPGEVSRKSIHLSTEEILLLNPETGTLPLFAAAADAQVTLGVYARHQVIGSDPSSSPWRVRFRPGLFHMTNDSIRFKRPGELRALGARPVGCHWVKDAFSWRRLYEGKLVAHYDHRFGQYLDGLERTTPVTYAEHLDSRCEPQARYYVGNDDAEEFIRARLGKHGWDREWLLVWRNITSSQSARVLIPSVVPELCVGNSLQVALLADPRDAASLQTVMSSLVFDYLARQKLSGNNLTLGLMKQLAAPTPSDFAQIPGWADVTLREWVQPRILELTYTGDLMEPYARDVAGGADPGLPYRWDPFRRELISAELDAAMLHVYGVSRPEAEHVLDSFSQLHVQELRGCGEFRTRRLVLEIYDGMTRAARAGEPYRTILDPPPGEGPRPTAPSMS